MNGWKLQQTERTAWVQERAARALDLVEAGDEDAAALLVREVTERDGMDGLIAVMLTWCELYADHLGDGLPLAATADHVAMINPQTGALTNSTRVPAEVWWASRLISAWIRSAAADFAALINELTSGDYHAANGRVAALLECIAMTRAAVPRGMATMGAGVRPDLN